VGRSGRAWIRLGCLGGYELYAGDVPNELDVVCKFSMRVDKKSIQDFPNRMDDFLEVYYLDPPCPRTKQRNAPVIWFESAKSIGLRPAA